jgi:DNA (cytosine-5)-methyltransferase 1
MNTTMKAISLFSGMGGDSLGITMAGLDLLAYSEKESKFRETHELNFNNCNLLGNGDITKTSNDDLLYYKNKVNLIFAGFPCQGFSQAGKKMSNDPRNTLFREFLRATKLINPKYIIGENVKGLLTRKTDNGELFIEIIQTEFETIGYTIYKKVMKCNLHGIPQNRQRLIIVGIRNDLQQEFEFPQEQENNTNLKNIINFSMEGAIKIDKDDFDMTTIPNECILKNMENSETEQSEGDKKPHPNLKLLSKDKNYEYKGTIFPRRIHFGKRIPVGGEIIDIRKPINTIICTYARQPRFFIPLQNKNGYYLRCLLPDELKQIQGFPEDYKIVGNKSQQIIQIGNAVPPPLIKQVIKSLKIHTET